jgi:hypothetical protein
MQLLTRGWSSALLFVTVAEKHWKAGILRESRIGQGQFAEKKDGAVRGFDAARKKTIGTQTGTQQVLPMLLRIGHGYKDSAGCGRGDC